MFDLAGRVAVITGGGKGLGRAYARWMASQGVRVVVNNRVRPGAPSSAQMLVEEIRAAGGIAVADEHAVEDPEAGESIVQAAVDTFGQLDIVVANAGVVGAAALDELDVAGMRKTMEINFWGSVAPVLAALPAMRAADYGRIVMTVSTAGFFGRSASAAYGASRAAVVGFARSLAVDTRDDTNIRINMISPSAFTDAAGRDPRYKELMDPMKVAPVVGWLSSEHCDRSGLIVHAGCGRARLMKILGSQMVESPDGDLAAHFDAFDEIPSFEEADHASAAGRVLRPEMV